MGDLAVNIVERSEELRTMPHLKPLIDIGDSSKREWIAGGLHNHAFIRTPG